MKSLRNENSFQYHGVTVTRLPGHRYLCDDLTFANWSVCKDHIDYREENARLVAELEAQTPEMHRSEIRPLWCSRCGKKFYPDRPPMWLEDYSAYYCFDCMQKVFGKEVDAL